MSQFQFHKIFSWGASSIDSFMAKHGITDYDIGIDRFSFGPNWHLQTSGQFMGLSAEDSLPEKVCVRTKEFNTINIDAEEQKCFEAKKVAADYHRSSKGGL